jgi:LysM repeat protein
MLVFAQMLDKFKSTQIRWMFVVIIFSGFTAACQPQAGSLAMAGAEEQHVGSQEPAAAVEPSATLLPTRPAYPPGELVDYIVQSGDTLPALAQHFNTSIPEIREANPIIPENATTLPPGMPMKIPIYYLPLWGTSYQILPDSYYVNGPHQVNFDSQAFLSDKPGWLDGYVEYAAGDNRSAQNFLPRDLSMS